MHLKKIRGSAGLSPSGGGRNVPFQGISHDNSMQLQIFPSSSWMKYGGLGYFDTLLTDYGPAPFYY